MLKHLNELRIAACFWSLGLLNNVLYVVILSAAADIVSPSTPKGLVLLANIVPCFIFKVSGPYFLHLISYRTRFATLSVLALVANLLIAYGSTPIKIFGVMLSSVFGGLGELTYLQLTAMFGPSSIKGYSSGTGAAGLLGSFVFMVFTTWWHMNPSNVLALFCFVSPALPLIYAFGLPWDQAAYEPINQNQQAGNFKEVDLAGTFRRIKPLVLPYIVPLASVYVCEYTINQGISPTLLFELEDMPFEKYRDAYVTYNALYQVGVFVSRSSASWFRVMDLRIPAILQAINLFICILQSLYVVFPNVYWIFALTIYEGLLGGLAFVNTYMLLSERVPLEEREFSMGVVGVSDSAGVVVAGILSTILQPVLCAYQQSTGRPWCTL